MGILKEILMGIFMGILIGILIKIFRVILMMDSMGWPYDSSDCLLYFFNYSFIMKYLKSLQGLMG